MEVDVDEALVRGLLATLPATWRHLRDASVTPVAVGWDNSVWRVGPRYAVRIPVREAAAPLLANEAAWAEVVSAPLRERGIVVPRPVYQGATPERHPWPWLLVEWVAGEPLSRVAHADRGPVAAALAEALPGMHRPAPAQAPVNPARGVTLRERAAITARAAEQARAHLGEDCVGTLLARVGAAQEADGWPHPPVWCHGDLHDQNLVLDTDAATGTAVGTVGVLDFGDLTSGDPAVDLRVLWTTFTADQRATAVQSLAGSGAYDPHVWQRARGWAAAFVLAVAADERGRGAFAATIAHACAELQGS